MIPSATDLTYFVEVAQTLNVSRAAERLGISQPSLSLALKRLEKAVDAELFKRGKRGVMLTAAGKRVLNHSKVLLQAWENVRVEAQASQNEVQGSYAIGCHVSVALSIVSHFMPALMERYPLLNLDLRHDLSRKVLEDVISMKTDIGVVVNPVEHPDLVIHKVCRDEVTFWTAASGKPRNQKILVCDPDLAQSQTLLKRMNKSGLEFERFVFSGSLEVIAELVASGGGVGILPARVAVRAHKKLKRVLKAPVFYDDHCLVFRVENKNVKAIQAISAAIRSSF